MMKRKSTTVRSNARHLIVALAAMAVMPLAASAQNSQAVGASPKAQSDSQQPRPVEGIRDKWYNLGASPPPAAMAARPSEGIIDIGPKYAPELGARGGAAVGYAPNLGWSTYSLGAPAGAAVGYAPNLGWSTYSLGAPGGAAVGYAPNLGWSTYSLGAPGGVAATYAPTLGRWFDPELGALGYYGGPNVALGAYPYPYAVAGPAWVAYPRPYVGTMPSGPTVGAYGPGAYQPSAPAATVAAPQMASAPQPIICLMKPTEGDADSDVAVIAQNAGACSSIGGKVAASQRAEPSATTASGSNGG